jgi:NAD-dependent DNA ligase
MVENINSTTLEVQGSFALTYMVRFIPLNLRSQEMDKSLDLYGEIYFHLVTLRAQRSERAGASEAGAVRDLARGIDN